MFLNKKVLVFFFNRNEEGYLKARWAQDII